MTDIPVEIGLVLLLHGVGDYLLQSSWMAETKTKRSGAGWWAAFVHAVFYTVPFLVMTTDWRILGVIAGTHLFIDHWRLAKHFIWIRNWIGPVKIRRGRGDYEPWLVVSGYNPPWSQCTRTGFPDRRPVWLTTWLLFITDNLIHVLIAIAALWYWG